MGHRKYHPFPLLALVGAALAACSGETEPPNGGQVTAGGSAAGGTATGGVAMVGGGAGAAGAGGSGGAATCTVAAAAPAPLRRLTRFEYNNTVRDLAKVSDAPANLFPPEDIGSGFGADAKLQSISSGHVEKYMTAARKIAAALTSADRIADLAPCAVAPAVADEPVCVQTVIGSFMPRVFRHPLEPGDAESMGQLFQTVRGAGSSFASSLAAVLEGALQSPEFLYRVEFGKTAAEDATLRRPSDYEMATRLSYLYYGSMPDELLFKAAAAGELSAPEGVAKQAERMLDDPKARDVVRFFFDSLLPIQALGSLTRSKDYGGFTQEIGALMRQETQTFLRDQVFNGGTWPGALTAPYTFLNQQLAEYYGIPDVTGTEMRKVTLDGVKRAGLLTQAGMVSGPIHSDPNNPVVRGSFILNKLMCIQISTPPPSLGPIVPPDPGLGGTARDRYSAHSAKDQCKGCHTMLDPLGFALENFTSVGQWQDTENGKTIDVTVTSPQLGTFSGAVELGKKLAESADVQACFASNWANFAYGRPSGDQDDCTMQQLQASFKNGGYSIKQLLLALSQTNTFLYLPEVRP